MDPLTNQSDAIFGLANATVLLAVAVFLTFVPPATLPKRLLALVLALFGIQALTSLGRLEAFSSPAWGPLFGDTAGLELFAQAAFFLVYPRMPRGRGWATWLAWVQLPVLVALGAMFSFARGLNQFPPGYGSSILFNVLFWTGTLATVGAAISFIERARGLPPGEEAGARWIAVAFIASFFTRPGAFVMYGVQNALGLPTFNPFDESQVFGAPLWVPLAIHGFARVVAPPIVLVWMWRQGIRSPLALLAFGFVFPDFTSLTGLLLAILPAYTVLRHGAMRTPRVSAGWAAFLAAAAAVSILLASIAITLSLLGDAPLSLALGLGLGLLTALLVAGLVVLPLTRTWAQEVARTVPAGPAPIGEPLPGDLVLGRYRIVRELGRGGMGAAYLAHDGRIDREVVLKVLRGPEAQHALREARALAHVRHPNVVQVLDVENVPDGALLLMEHVDGGSLAQRLERGALDRDEFASVARDVLDALAAVHAAGLVHRDLKPGNVLLTARGQAKLADFGIARRVDGQVTVRGIGAGEAAGTLRFMSPEVARGRDATPRSDLFSLGATLFEAWTGEPYLAAKTGESAFELQLRAAAAKPLRRRVRGPPALQAWFARALEPAPEKRFADAAEMRAALDAALLTPGSTAASDRRR